MGSEIDTRCVHGPRDEWETTRAVSFPIYQSATFGHVGLGHSSGFDYTREKNPTRSHIESVVSGLEGAAATFAFSSGMAAVSACFELFAPGDHIICSEDLYGGVVRMFDVITQKNGITISFVDTTDLAAIELAVTPQTRALYIETPSNPMMNVTDIEGAAKIAHANDLLLIVDNTFLSPYLQNPLSHGADLVVHSGSKFLAGHNDTIAGFVCSRTPELGARIELIGKTTGGILSPFDSWLVARGIKTLAVRMERAEKNAHTIAQWLTLQPAVSSVLYVGLSDHPGYAINARQARGAGSMISFRVDTAETARTVLERVRLITFAESLGGVESLITYPMVQTHPDVPEEAREHLGITDTLLRLSVGIEDVADLLTDLEHALSRE